LNKSQSFAIAVQALLQARGDNNVRTMMQTGRWMVVVDEYHHYGLDKAWGRSVRSLPAVFLLALSATPTRPQDDSAFGSPHIKVGYRDAVEEKAVKPLKCHAYNYRIDALTPDGQVKTYTTEQLLDEAGTDSPDGVEKWRIERKMRWSPKYVSPLVIHPILRMAAERTRTSAKLQVLIKAMCVSHAELVCEQVGAMHSQYRVDWIGTGPNGRNEKDNKRILDEFCPPKGEDGRRHPKLDILVHVGMAGEGADTCNVTEVVHLDRANKNNFNDQQNGRASRYLSADDGTAIHGHINVDTTSAYARFAGDAIMDAMDLNEPSGVPDEPPEPGTSRDIPPLPEEPAIGIIDMELEWIDSGDLQRVAELMADQTKTCHISGFTIDAITNCENPFYDALRQAYREMRRREAEALDPQSVIMQWQEQVENALTVVTGRAVRLILKNGQRPEKSFAGDIKKRINTKKKIAVGAIARNVDVYRAHWQWLQQLDQFLIHQGLPTWLS